MQAEVISIGDELTSGQRLDTNSQWLSQRLAEIGIAVAWHTTVGDDLEVNVAVFREAARRADVVISTGGLGPTADDLTRDALARLVGGELVLDEGSLAHIRGLFARRRGRPMPERNVVQAMFPPGSRPIFNPEGTAPGIALEIPRDNAPPCRVFALPGVPAEMKQMWQETVGPTLAALGGGRVICHRRIKCFGVGESDLEAMLPDLIQRGRVPSVGITVSEATITLRLTASGRTADEAMAAMEPTVATIYECLGPLVFGEEDDELQHAVVRLLIQRGLSLATIEWGTGGLVAEWLGSVAEEGGYYAGGLVAAGETALVRMLDLPPGLVATHAQQPEGVISAAAEACRHRFGVDLGLAVGGADWRPSDHLRAGPTCIALATRKGVDTARYALGGHQAIIRPRTAKQALNVVRLALGEAWD